MILHQVSSTRWKSLLQGAASLFAIIAGIPAIALGQNLDDVPGVVISHVPYDSSNHEFIGTSSITIMPNGDYIASHDLFGSGTNEDQTKVFRSTDQGATWTEQSTVDEAFWGTVFQHQDDLYLWSVREGGSDGDILLRRSTDYGVTWTTPTNSTNGVLKEGDYGNTANVPVIHNGRLWIGVSRRVMSASVNSDLLQASSWKLSNEASAAGHPFGSEFEIFSEGQVVASPQLGVHVLPKLRNLPHTALIDVEETSGDITFDASAEDAFPYLPGGEKKFGAGYDPISGKYYVLSNPVLKEHEGLFDDRPTLVRNTAGILSSKDLINWDVEKLFLYGSKPLEEAFQYLNFVIDGDDLAVVSRTAFEDGLGGARNNHDSNLMTFHRVEDFRNAEPVHVLVADTGNDRVMRYEVTDGNEWAPLGPFTLGSTFDGQPLSNPVGVAQASNGDVFIADKTSTTGRVLRFDSSGNFLNTIVTQGTDFTGDPEGLVVGPDEQLYMSVAFGSNSDKIYKIDPTTGTLSTFVDTNFSSGQSLDNPRGLEFAPNGDLYVADRNSDAIRRFRGSDGAYLGTILSPRQPQALAWDDTGNQFLFSQRTTSSDTDILTTPDDGSSTQVLYTNTDIGLALGAEAIDGEHYWTDFSNNEVYQAQSGQSKRIVVAQDLLNPSYLKAIKNVALSDGESTWTGATSNTWAESSNWYYWGRADTDEDLAVLGSAIDSETTVSVDSNFTIRGIRFLNPAKYVLAGMGEFTLESSQGSASIDVQLGDHEIAVAVQLADDIDVTVATGASLLMAGDFDLSGHIMELQGQGDLSIGGTFTLDSGTLAIDEESQLSFSSGVSATLDGTLQFIVDQPLTLPSGASFDLLDGTEFLNGATFTSVSLPSLSDGLYWDISSLYDSGEISVGITVGSDFNSDGAVDDIDLGVWENNIGLVTGASRSQGDADQDGDVDGYDFLKWQREYTGQLSVPISASVAQVPEPSARNLLAICSVLYCCYSRFANSILGFTKESSINVQ